MVINASSTLLQVQAANKFSIGILTQICGLLNIHSEGLVCMHSRRTDDDTSLIIMAAAGSYAKHVGASLNDIDELGLCNSAKQSLIEKKHVFDGVYNYIHFPLTSMGEIVVIINNPISLNETELKLVECFGMNIAIGVKDTRLFEELESIVDQDSLTKLPNRTHFSQQLNQKIKKRSLLDFLI